MHQQGTLYQLKLLCYNIRSFQQSVFIEVFDNKCLVSSKCLLKCLSGLINPCYLEPATINEQLRSYPLCTLKPEAVHTGEFTVYGVGWVQDLILCW